MSLRIKILLPMLLVIAAFSTLLHLYWIPQFHQHYSEEIIKEQVAALEILASAIEDPLLSGDLGKLYATLQSIESQHPDWAHLNIQRMDGTQVYPLDTLESHHHSHTVISRTITQHDKPLFNIQLHINFEEKLNSSTQLFNDLEILFALLILPIVVVTIALQDKMIFMPLRALITASRGLTAGDYNTAIASGPRDETGELLNSFRQMRDAIVEREVKLLSSEERLKAIFENVTNGIVTTDASGYIVSSNLAFQTIFDYRDHELEGRHISELIPEVDSLLQQLEHTANHESHARRGCCSGETVGSDRNAKPLALEVTFNQVMLNNSPMVLGVIEEISERLQQRAREERYHQLANTRATIAQILQKGQTTLEQRLVLALNRLFAIDPLVAYRRGAIISRDTQGGGLTILASTGSFLPEELEALRDDGVTQTLYERISASGEALISGNCTDQHGRRSAPVEPHGHYIIPMNYSGTTHGLLYLYTDATPDTASDITAFLQQIAEMLALAITENNAIIALTEARDRAEQHAQAKSNFLANMSHEIRTPLNGVLGSLELLIDGELSEEQRAYATTAFRSSELLLRLINDILDISKFESGHLKIEAIEFDLIDMVEELLALFSSAAVKKGINISWTLDQGIAPTFVGDRTRLLQILGNLVSNAIKFTDRGEIRIDIRREERDERGELLMFSITDTGMGIDKADQQRIFGEFEQVDSSTTRRFGGTGLGLSICRKLTQIMGGDIGLVSTPGEGSTFWFTLHLPFGEAPNAAQKAHSYANIRALIVDTTPTQFNVIQHILRDAAVECSHASNSAQTFSLID
ncbi:MAG: ATP-binding protein, partial [Chromatiales bacterium]|nr:ATP-binding protein [Chromatiales bacterium]